MVSCDFPNKNRRHQEEERPCGIYPYGVELPANHPILLETFLYNLAEVEYCWFFPMGANQKLIEAGQLMYVDTREGVTNSAYCRFSQKIVQYICFQGRGNILARVALPPNRSDA